jgi:hypothetical protein
MRKLVQVLSKKYGLVLKADAARYLDETLTSNGLSEAQRLESLDYIATTYIKHQGTKRPFHELESLPWQLMNGHALLLNHNCPLACCTKPHIGSGNLIVDKESLEAVMDSILRKASVNELHGENGEAQIPTNLEDISAFMHIVDAFEMPRWIYKPDEKAFMRFVRDCYVLMVTN